MGNGGGVVYVYFWSMLLPFLLVFLMGSIKPRKMAIKSPRSNSFLFLYCKEEDWSPGKCIQFRKKNPVESQFAVIKKTSPFYCNIFDSIVIIIEILLLLTSAALVRGHHSRSSIVRMFSFFNALSDTGLPIYWALGFIVA